MHADIEPESGPEEKPPTSEGRARARPRAGISRGLILATLEETPGLGFRELARRTGLASGTLSHHLRVLLRHRIVWTVRHGYRLRHFCGPRPNEAGVHGLLAAHVLDEFDRTLLALVREVPRVQKDLLDRFAGMPRSTTQHRLSRLVAWGFLATRRAGRCLVYEPKPEALCVDKSTEHTTQSARTLNRPS